MDAMFAAQTEARMVSQWLGRDGLDGPEARGLSRLDCRPTSPSQHRLLLQRRGADRALTAAGYTLPNWLAGLPAGRPRVRSRHRLKHPGGASAPSTREFVADAFGAATNSFANEPAPYHEPDFVVGGDAFYCPACYDTSTESWNRTPRPVSVTTGSTCWRRAPIRATAIRPPPPATTPRWPAAGSGRAMQILYNAMLMKTRTVPIRPTGRGR